MNKALPAAAATLLFIEPRPHSPQTPSAEQRFRELYKELVETNTSLSAGSCTLAAERMAAPSRLPGSPTRICICLPRPDIRGGRMVAVYPGRNAEAQGGSAAGAP